MRAREMKANIKRGIKWLDKNRPGWKPKVRAFIEADKFNMVLPCNCVIGATDGSFDKVFGN